MKSKIPLYKPSISNNEKKNVLDCLNEKWISSKGKYVKKFENLFKKKFNYKYATVTTNGTTALHLCLLSLGIKKNDEIIVPNLTYVAPVNAITYVGAKPVLVDVNKETLLMEVEDIKKKISNKTKAILLVHLYGFMYNMDSIKKIKKNFKVKIIEDCAEAIGSKFKSKYAGNFGDISTFSFYGNKTISTGEGGMVVTNSKYLIDRVTMFKSQGLNIKKKNNYYNHEVIGYNYRMTNICASIGCAQLKRVDFFIKKKKIINKWYKKYLNSNYIDFQKEINFSESSFWLVNIILKNKNLKKKLVLFLKNKSIETRPIFKPMNKLKIYKELNNSFVNSYDIYLKGISLPSYPELNETKIKYISSQINFFLKKNR